MLQRGLGFVGHPKKTHGSTGPDVESTFEGPEAWALFRQISLSGFMCSQSECRWGDSIFAGAWGCGFDATIPISTCCCPRIREPARVRRLAAAADHDVSTEGRQDRRQGHRQGGGQVQGQEVSVQVEFQEGCGKSRFRCRGPGPGKGEDATSPSSRTGGAPRAYRRPEMPLAQAPTLETSDSDIALVKRAIETLRNNNVDDATRIEASISDPVARKLVEWAILRDGDNGAEFSRYAAFIAANPTWPSVAHVPSPRRGDAVGRGSQSRESAQLFQRLAAGLRQGPPGAGACLARGR